MEISAEEANHLRWQDEYGDLAVVDRQRVSSGRWYEVWIAVFQDEVGSGRYWAYEYERPLTEMQEVVDFTEPVKLFEVVPEEVIYTSYERVD